MLEAYRKIGPFGRDTLPQGLLAEHSLRGGTWGRLTMLRGAVGFIWDDNGERIELKAGDVHLITPERHHHLDITGAFELEIEFLREA